MVHPELDRIWRKQITVCSGETEPDARFDMPAPDIILNPGITEMKSKILGTLAVVALLTACAEKNTATSTGAGAATSGPVPGSQEDLVANVGDRVFFDFDRSTLKSDAQATLDRQAGWLAKYPQVNVQVAGNCDDRGTEEYNLALGQRRANASRDYLVARGAVGARITTISYGKDRPTALGDNEQAWAQNRNTITSVR
jgi:peptidoglycan-associated lipoprotein